MDMQVMKKATVENEDRISKLSDDVIHQIMYFMDIRSAVQTSILSKRWKYVWRTLPFLYINDCPQEVEDRKKLPRSKFLQYVFSRRSRQSRILKLELYPNARELLDLRLIKKYVKYAISRNVEHLSVQSSNYCSLSMFNSDSLKVLKVLMKFESEEVMASHCWTLPNLKVLFLARNHDYLNTIRKFPQSCLTCLPALTTLGLSHCRLPEIFSFPGLTTLYLHWCTLPQKVWVLPALLNLKLSNVVFPVNMSEYFRALVSLHDLVIDFGRKNIGSCVISNSQLVNLKTRAPLNLVNASEAKIVVLAPKLCNFSAIGFFPTTFEGSMLENVNIKFWDWTMYRYSEKQRPSWVLKQHLDLFRIMLSQLRSAKVLTLDLVTLQALSEISDILVDMHSPFNSLKFFKLPPGCEESSISSSVRKYLLGGSPRATIVKTLYREDVSTTKELKTSQYTHMYDELVDLRVPKESMDMVEHTVVDDERVRQIGAPVAGPRNDQASSSWENSHMVLCQGHEVNSEFLGLLDLIMKKYPETFEQLPPKNKKILTMKLNMFCSSVNAFTKTSKTEVNTEMLTEYRALFTDFQRWGFNINWLMRHLNDIEQHWCSKPLLYELHAIDSRIDDAESKLQDLRTLRAEKMTGSGSSQIMATSFADTAGYIGDDIL